MRLFTEVVPCQIQQCKQQAYDDAGGYGEVYPVVLPFNGNIAGQLSEERNFGAVGYEKAGHDAKNTNEYQELAHGLFFL